MFWSKKGNQDQEGLKVLVDSYQATCCNHAQVCPRCGYPIEGLVIVCPRCREKLSQGCSGNCSTCSH